MIKGLQVKLRETSDGNEFQQTLGVIRYLTDLKVGSIVDTPDGEGVVVEPCLLGTWSVYTGNKGTQEYRASELTVVG